MKKIRIRILAMLMALMMVLTIMPSNVYAGDAQQGSTESTDLPEESTVNAQVYFTSAATGKIITLDGVENNPIDCNMDYNSSNIPANGLFTIYYGVGNWGDTDGKTVVNFTNTQTKTSWKADNDKVFQITKRTNPGGWESVLIEPQGDGTICFKSCASLKYVTIGDGKLTLINIKDGEKPSSNEKFVIHTTTAPKTAKKVTLSQVAGDSMTVSWTGVDKSLYSGYEVMYSTQEDSGYKSAGKTSGTTLDIKGLELSTKYYVKVRTQVNGEGLVYSDSKVAYATTLKELKPTVPQNVFVGSKDGEMNVTWDASKSTNKYEVYRAESRYSKNYTKIGETTDTSYTDATPNSSKYRNYYKIKACNNSDESKLSDAGSLEISMFGKNMYIFSDTDSASDINEITEDIFQKQHYNQFGEERYAIAYKPGDYTGANYVNMGYYTQMIGLGKLPTDVRINNVKTPSALSGNNATCNFWVGIENVTIAKTNDEDFQWGVSQAAPARRLNVERKATFDWYYGWASGGFVSDSKFQSAAGSLSQQQYYYRNCDVAGGTYGVNWNQVIQGCTGTTVDMTPMKQLISEQGSTNWSTERAVEGQQPTTVIDKTATIREKPFLYFDTEKQDYKVFVPAMRKDSQGISWSENNMGAGTSISVDKYFYIANPEKDTAATINKQLRMGKNILFQPGVYHVSEPIKVTRSNTVLLGLGMASIIPDNEDSAIKVSDVGGVSVAGLILDAGNHSQSLLTVGHEGANADHSDNPIVIQDVFFRVGGTGNLGRADQCMVINSNNTIIDHTWIWRADHGDHTGWNANTSKNGLVVNGDHVTAYGLFCEHFQEYDIIWRGEYGSTYFLQNEKCYDPQNQDDWMSHNGSKKGYAAYKVTNNVKHHYAVGLGVYDVFINTNGASIYLDNAMEVPDTEGVLIENACIVDIASDAGPKVGINHIVNDTTFGIRRGEGNGGGFGIQRLLSYNNTKSTSLGDVYANATDTTVIKETGVTPTVDNTAEKDIIKEEPTKPNDKPIWDMTDDDFDDKLAQGEKDDPTGNDNNNNNNNGNNSNTNNSNSSTSGTQTTILKKNQKFTVGKFTYKVTKITGKKGTVTLSGVTKKYSSKLKTATVKATVTYKGYKLNINAIGSKAFAKSKKLKKIIIKGTNLKSVKKNAFYKKIRKTLKITAKKSVKKKVLKSLKRKK